MIQAMHSSHSNVGALTDRTISGAGRALTTHCLNAHARNQWRHPQPMATPADAVVAVWPDELDPIVAFLSAGLADGESADDEDVAEWDRDAELAEADGGAATEEAVMLVTLGGGINSPNVLFFSILPILSRRAFIDAIFAASSLILLVSVAMVGALTPGSANPLSSIQERLIPQA